jgi:hypothetical protein
VLPFPFRKYFHFSLDWFSNQGGCLFARRRGYAFLVVLSFLAFVKTTSAQTSVYGAIMLDAFGFTGATYSSAGSFKPDTGGVIGGAFYTFPSSSRLKAGIDGRVIYSAGYNGGSAYTGALRVSFVPNRNRLRPYLQLGGGVASTQLNQAICNGFGCSTSTSRVTNGVAQIAFGLDVRATPHLDIRALDYGADAGSTGNGAHAAAVFLDAGVVYHF